MGSIENVRCGGFDSNSVEVNYQRPLFTFIQFKILLANLSAGNHGSSFHHLRLDICFHDYNSDDSQQVRLKLKLFHFRNFFHRKNCTSSG